MNVPGNKVNLVISDSKDTILSVIDLSNTNQQIETDEYIFHLDSFETKDSQANYKELADFQVSISNMMTKVYTILNYFTGICFLGGIWLIIRKAWKGDKPSSRIIWLEIGMVLSWVALLMGVSYTHISAYNAIKTVYLSAGYPFMYAFLLIPEITLMKKTSNNNVCFEGE